MFEFLKKENITGNKKTIENLVLFLVLFIIIIVVINGLGKNETKTVQSNSSDEKILSLDNYKEKTQEEKLEEILSLINGAGKVDVLITYSNGMEQIPMYNTKQSTTTVQEADTAGGTRKTEETSNEQTVIYNENGNNKTPVMKQVINPKAVGVIVVADGAGIVNVKEDMIKAIEAILDVPAHRVQVFSRRDT